MSNMETNLWGIVESAWKVIRKGYEKYNKKYPELIFHEDKIEEFGQFFEEQYKDVMKRFMQKDTSALDAHKQAAILTISCLKSNVIEHNIDNKDSISIIPQLIAINVGLSYMKDCINDVMRKKGINKSIDKYYLPVAVACDTPYQEIMCRILYHEQTEQDMSFNVLELADRYFLLEYINLIQRGIEPYLLKE